MVKSTNDFIKLRQMVLVSADNALKKRLRENPNPNEDELRIGCFVEELEEQCRDAIVLINKKGYSGESSGFMGDNCVMQMLDGYFDVEHKTKERLRGVGVDVLKGKDVDLPGSSDYYSYIRFKANRADLNDIKAKWDSIATALPDKQTKVISISGASVQFRKKYAPERIDLEKEALEKMLKVQEFAPEYVEKFQNRLREISLYTDRTL